MRFPCAATAMPETHQTFYPAIHQRSIDCMMTSASGSTEPRCFRAAMASDSEAECNITVWQ